jgi:hypothetical protein
MSNTIYIEDTIDIAAMRRDELRKVENELIQTFCRYDVPFSWILTVAELLQKYEVLSGKKYKPNFPEDSII